MTSNQKSTITPQNAENTILFKNEKASDTVFEWREFACGWGAAFVNITISFPLNKLIFRQMLHGVSASPAFHQLQHEGLGFLYRGMLPPLMQKTVSSSLMFGVYNESLIPLIKLDINPYLAKSIAGIIAGTVEAVLVPFERIQTLLVHPDYHKLVKNTKHAARYIATNYGAKEFYRGLTPVLLRNGPSNALFFIIRDEIHCRLPEQKDIVYQSIQCFIAGASIGAFLSTLYYPLNVIKISMQSRLGGPHLSLIQEWRYLYIERGSKFRNLYHGALLNCTRAFLSWGIINAAYEMFRKILYNTESDYKPN